MLIERKIHQDGIPILNIYTPSTRAPKIINETLLPAKSYIDPHTVQWGNFNLNSPINMLSALNLNIGTKVKCCHKSNETSRYIQNISLT